MTRGGGGVLDHRDTRRGVVMGLMEECRGGLGGW